MSRPMEEDANKDDLLQKIRDLMKENADLRKEITDLREECSLLRAKDRLRSSSTKNHRPMEEDANGGKNEEGELNTVPQSVLMMSVKNNTQEVDLESGQKKRDWREESVAFRRLAQRLISSIDSVIEKSHKMDEESSEEEG